MFVMGDRVYRVRRGAIRRVLRQEGGDMTSTLGDLISVANIAGVK